MKVKLNWDLNFPVKKGDIFPFNWSSPGPDLKGFAKATEDFKKVNLSKKKAKELDTTPGIHYFGEAIATYS